MANPGIMQSTQTTTNEHIANKITLESYNLNVDAYIAGTPAQVSGGFKTWIDATVALMHSDARIIEIGSGCGRDAAYIESQGFTVERTDAAQGFVTLLQEQGYNVRSFNILTDDFVASYDLVYAAGVFLHFTPAEFTHALIKIHGSLTLSGIISFSVKEGVGEEWDTRKLGSPRYFCYWTQQSIAELLCKTGFEILALYEADSFICVIARKMGNYAISSGRNRS
jgi:hypothetical protein